MNCLVKSTKATGGLGGVGVFIPEDPNAPDDLQKEGKMAFDFGNFWFEGQKIGTGQCNVKHYNRRLMKLIEQDRANPAQIISHRLPLDQEILGSDRYRLTVPCGVMLGRFRTERPRTNAAYSFYPERLPEACTSDPATRTFLGDMDVAIGPNRDIALFAGRFGAVRARLHR